jgi:hypothetical protein
MADTLLAYLLTQSTDSRDAYMGAVMVTDARGLPVEFRYTQPVRPTRLQRVLYGGALEEYLRADVIGACLLKDLKSRPTAALVREDLLMALDSAVEYPVVLVFPTNLEPLEAEVGAERQVDGQTVLLQLSPKSGPVRVTVSREDASLCSAVRDILTGIAASMEVCEPLERLEEALKLLWTEADKADSSKG